MAPRPQIPPELKRRPFSLSEAKVLGVTRRALSGKSWRRLGRGLYCWKGLDHDPWRLLVAWRAMLPSNAVFAGFTAAWLHRLDVDPCNPVEVVAPGVRSRRGLVVRQCQITDVALARGLPATSLNRTFSDLGRRLSEVELLVLADQAMRLNLGRFHDEAAPAESPMETRLRWTLLRAGLPRPQVQAELRGADGRFLARVDLYYPSARLVIEYDGVNHRERLAEDNRRQNLLTNAGYKLLRFTAADVLERTHGIAMQVRHALMTFS